MGIVRTSNKKPGEKRYAVSVPVKDAKGARRRKKSNGEYIYWGSINNYKRLSIFMF